MSANIWLYIFYILVNWLSQKARSLGTFCSLSFGGKKQSFVIFWPTCNEGGGLEDREKDVWVSSSLRLLLPVLVRNLWEKVAAFSPQKHPALQPGTVRYSPPASGSARLFYLWTFLGCFLPSFHSNDCKYFHLKS